MKKIYNRLLRVSGFWLLPLLFTSLLLALPQGAFAQTFDIEDPSEGTTSDPAEQYVVGEDLLGVKIINLNGFTVGNRFYFYYNDDGVATNLTEERVIQSQPYGAGWLDAGRTFSGLFNETGTFNLYVAHWTGRFDYEQKFTGEDVSEVLGGTMYSYDASAVDTYTSGNISTDYGNPGPGDFSSCPELLTVNIPDGAVITSVDVEYNMTAYNGAWMSEQRSRIVCVSTGGTAEPSYYSGVGATGGTYPYSRSGLDIANGVTGGGDIVFEMHAFRTWPGSVAGDCNTTYNYVDNGSWTITVNYDTPATFNQPGNRSLTTNIFNLSGETEGDVELHIDFLDLPVEDYSVLVEYSTNGTTWTAMADKADNDEFYSGLGEYNPEFVLPLGAINDNTQFRIRQKNSAVLGSGQEVFSIELMALYKGTPMALVYAEPVGTYNIIEPPGPPTPGITINQITDDEDNLVDAGNRALPGDEVTITASTSNITLADYSYFVEFGGEILPVSHIIATRMDQANDELELDIKVPANIPEFFNNNSAVVRILVVDGTEIIYGEGAISNRNLITYDYPDDEIEISGGEEDPAGTIDFVEAGARHIVTPVMEISTEEGATLQFTIARLSDAIPPEGNEIVVEYSTNGSIWNQLGNEIELGGTNGVGLGGDTFILDETELAGIASASTQFRVRQKNTGNGANVHTWRLSGFVLNVPATGGNILVQSAGTNLWIGQPSFTLALADTDMPPLYPGETVELLVENIEGEFPDYTVYEVYYGNKWLKTLDALANFNVTLPLDNGFKTLVLRAEASNWELEGSVNFTIQPVSLDITDVSYDYDDAGTVYNIPGSDVEVEFSMTGYIRDGLDASVILQVWNQDSEWETIGIQEVTVAINSNQGGTITGTLPQYEYGATANLRILIENYPWAEGDYIDKVISRNLPNNTYTDGDYRYYRYGNYNGLNLQPGSKIAFQMFTSGFEGDVEMVYSTDAAATWVPVENGLWSVAGGMEGYVTSISDTVDFIELPEELLGEDGNIWFAIRHLTVDPGDPLPNIRGLRIIQPDIVDAGTDNTTINIIYPSVTLATLEDEYNFGEEIDVQYSTFGIGVDAGAWFAVTLEQGDLYHVLKESNQTGEVTLGIQFPDAATLEEKGFITDTDDPAYTQFHVRARVFTKDQYDMLLIRTIEKVVQAPGEELTLVEDSGNFIEIKGYTLNDSDPDPANHRYEFHESGLERLAVTKAYDFSEMPEPVILEFTYEANIPVVNPSTLPKLQVSTDAGTSFITLDIPESVYVDRLPANGTNTFEVEIPSVHLTAATHFRWIQDVTVNSWWTIYDIKILSGESNLAPYQVNYYPVSYAMDLVEFVADPYADFDNLLAYEWTLIDESLDEMFTPAITVGENFNFSWLIKDEFYDEAGELDQDALDVAGAVVWPDGAVFQLYLELEDEEGDPYFYAFGTVADLDTFVMQLSDTVDIPTDTYTVYARGWIFDAVSGDTLHIWPGWVDPEDPDQGLNNPDAMTLNVLIINEITEDHLEIILGSIAAVNDDEEDGKFYFGGQMKVNYETFGPYEANVRFEVVLEGTDGPPADPVAVPPVPAPNTVYHNLGSQADLGAVTDTLAIPSKEDLEGAGFDLGEDVFVKVYAYHAETAEEELLIEQLVEHSLTDLDNDFLAVNNGADVASLTFDGVKEVDGVFTKRFAVTRSLNYYLGEGVVLNNHKLVYDYTEVVAISPVTGQTLPHLQVSTDAGTTFTNVEWLFETGTYEAELTQAMLDNAANIHFRWIQQHPSGEWSLDNIMIVSGESNLVADVETNRIKVDLEEVPSVYPDNFNNYEFIVGNGEENGLEPPVVVGEQTELHWIVDVIEDTDNIWPDGTVFEFTLDFEDPETQEDWIFAVVEDAGTITVEFPDIIETGIYTVSVRAYIGDIIEEGDEYEHVHPALDIDPTAVKSIMVVNLTEEDIRKIVADDLPNEDPLTLPEFDSEEEVPITFSIFGEWPDGTGFAAALEQVDNTGSFLERVALEEITSSVGSLTVMMPAFVHKHEDFNAFILKLYAYTGVVVDFGEAVEVEFMLTEGDGNTDLLFDGDGDRFALSEMMDLSGFDWATLNFNYVATNILENESTLPQLLVTIDGGDTFEYLEIDSVVSEFGKWGYLPANTAGMLISVDIPAEYLTATTWFMFEQDINRGDNKDVWSISDVEVVGESNLVANYLEENNEQEIEFNQPDLANYEWMVVKDENGFEPALYSGSTFMFTWAVALDDDDEPVGLSWPVDTDFGFYMVNYPDDDSLYHMDAAPVVGVDNTWEVTLPDDIQRDDYPVIVSVMKDEVVYIDVEEYNPPFADGTITPVGSVNVFNPLLVTQYPEQEVLYAGNSADFTAGIENNVTELKAEWYYNLILTDQWGDEWLLDANLGSVDFDGVTIPPFIRGARSFEIKASIGAAMSIPGQMVEGTADINLNNNADFIETFVAPYIMAGAEGSKVLLTTVAQDLTGIHSVKFDVEISELDLTGAQKLVLEYSADGGVSWTDIHSYPDARFDDEDLGMWFNEDIELPEAARTEATHLRWRIEEFKESFRLNNIALAHFATDYAPAPMAYQAVTVTVAEQRIDIPSTNELVYCNQGVVEIFYSIKGQFGADNVMTLESTWGTPEIDGNPVTFEGITDGTGSVTLDLGLLDDLLTGSDVKFWLVAEDETVEDYEFTVTGNMSGVGVGIIPEVPDNTAVYAQTSWQNEHLSCPDDERIVVIRNVVDNFSYQLRNHITGALIGTAVIADPDDEDLLDPDTYPAYNPGSGILEISVGTIDEMLKVEVLVTAQDASGDLVCDEMIPNMQATFTVRPLYTLHYDLDNTGVWTPVTDGQEFIICDGSLDLSLRMGYWIDGAFTWATAEWYRNEMTMPLGTMTTYSNFSVGGEYFAVYDDGECGEYQSASVTITINEKPAQPAITVTGETSLCEGGSAVLTAEAGYSYYRWTRNWGSFGAGNSQSITISEAGTYRVEVSNVPFDQNCHSVFSDPVVIDVFEFNNVWFPTSTVRLCPDGDGIAEVTVSGLQEGVTYYLVDDATDEVFGQPFSAPTWSVTIHTAPVEVSTSFNVLAVSDENADCSKVVSTNTLKIEVLPVYHTLVNNGTYWEVPGEDPYCEGVQLTIGEEDGTTGIAAGNVRWYKDGFEVSTSWWHTANEPGVYQARYMFNDDCWYYTEEVVISERPERPVLTYEGSPEFCEGEGDLVLIAPEGFAMYTWYRNGGQMQNVSTGDTLLNVVRSGDYQVMVSDMLGCGSPLSLPVNAMMHEKPERPTFTLVEDVLCEPGVASLLITNPWGNEDVMYQIYDVATGMPSGNARISSSNLYLESDVLSEDALLEVRAWRMDVESCGAVSLPFDVKVYNLNILISGNNLVASVPSTEAASYQWYRNGIMIRNNGDGQILSVYDEAEYSVVVVTFDGCVLESVANTKGDLVLDRIISEPFETSLYPNPAQDNLFIRLEGEYTGKLTIKIVNLTGATVYEATAEKTEAILRKDIPVSDLTQGVYMLHITGSDYFEVNQFIKK